MAPVRPFALFQAEDQWLRAAHWRTWLDPETGGVRLAPKPEPPGSAADRRPPRPPAGLAFDSGCRLYHSLPADGCIERLLWASQDPLQSGAAAGEPLDLFRAEPQAARGEFSPPAPRHGPIAGPGALAVDEHDHLFVIEAATRRLVVVDLVGRRVVRRFALGTQRAPLDLAASGRTVFVLSRPFGILRVTARSGPIPVEVQDPDRVLPLDAEVHALAASPSGRLAILARRRDGTGMVAPLDPRETRDPVRGVRRVLTVGAPQEVPPATDLEFQSDSVLVVGLMPGEDLLRFRDGLGDDPLKAKGYDGAGIVRTPDGRIAFWTDRGVRHAVPARVRYQNAGQVTTYALDGRDFRMTWGRLFIDACIPHGTDIHVRFATSDDLPEEEPTLPWAPPGNAGSRRPRSPELTPSLLPLSLAATQADRAFPVHRRPDGPELTWLPVGPDDPFMTYEVPVNAPPGRYLWLRLDLSGDGRSSPRVRCLRVERPGHDWMRRLPRIYSREQAAEAFLRRYLAMIDAQFVSLDDRAMDRNALVDPASTPPDLLPWLAGFVGLALDERWPVARRRLLVAEAVDLFRLRGTVPGLLRFLELCLGFRPILVEQFRVRGLGGAVLREAAGPVASSPVLGGGFRVGGSVGEVAGPAGPGATTTLNAFATNAHRFALILPGSLTGEQLAAVSDLLEVHRPAHTLVQICPVGAGMRIGSGLHVGLSSVVGRSSGWDRLQLGASTLGTTALLGIPGEGIAPGSASLGRDTRLA